MTMGFRAGNENWPRKSMLPALKRMAPRGAPARRRASAGAGTAEAHAARRCPSPPSSRSSALAGVARLTGAPDFLVVALAATGVACLAVLARAIRSEKRAASIISENTARNRAEIETLADRMWELQESEERFRGLIDALGDLVVHRDREGGIVYANKVFADLVGKDQRDLVGQTLAQLGVDVGIVPDAAFSDGECLSSTDVAIRSSSGIRWFSWIELSVRDKASRPGLASRDRPRHHFAQAGGNRADQRARARRIRQPGEVALPRHGEPRDPHADERHHGHGEAAGRHRAVARAADLCRRGLDLGQPRCSP